MERREHQDKQRTEGKADADQDPEHDLRLAREAGAGVASSGSGAQDLCCEQVGVTQTQGEVEQIVVAQGGA